MRCPSCHGRRRIAAPPPTALAYHARGSAMLTAGPGAAAAGRLLLVSFLLAAAGPATAAQKIAVNSDGESSGRYQDFYGEPVWVNLEVLIRGELPPEFQLRAMRTRGLFHVERHVVEPRGGAETR